MILVMSLLYERRIKTEKVLVAEESDGGFIYNSPLLPWLLVFALITYYATVRTDVNDSLAYIDIYDIFLEPTWDYIQKIATDNSSDKGFYILSTLFKMYISTDYHLWFFVISVICSISFIYFFRKYAVSYLDTLFFFFCTTLYFNFFSMMRQWLAISIVLFAFGFLRKGKFIPFMLICILAAQFHNSAYFMIPIYFLVRGEAWKRKQISIIAVFAIAVVFLSPLLGRLESSTTGWTYDYVAKSMNTNTGSSFIRPIIALIPVVFAFLFRNEIKDKTVNILINISLLNLLLNILAVFTSGLFVIRFSTYFSVFLTILFPYLLNVTLKDNPNIKIIKVGYYVFYFIYYWYQMSYSESWMYGSDILGYFM